MARKRRYRRRKRPKFKKFYKYNIQDEISLSREKLLQNIHSKIAKEVFQNLLIFPKGDMTLKMEGIVLYIDPVLGSQVEIEGTSELPLLKRLKIHIRLLKLIRSGHSILKAVQKCLKILKTQ